jgi:hypothetical protein
MKKLVILLLAILFTVPVMADGEKKQYDKVVITLVDGRVFDIEIDADSYIYSYTTEKGGQEIQMVEVLGVSEDYMFERDEIKSVKFVEAVLTGIDNVTEVSEQNPMRFIDGELVFHDSLHGEMLYVYDTAGKLVMSACVNSNANQSLDILPKGTYLAKVKECKLKVVVR